MNHFMLTPEDTFRRLFELNFLAAMSCTREATKLLQRSEQNHTSIVNISTVAVPWSLEGQLAYAASKASVEQATRVLSKELAPMNIRVNTLGLPIVETALMRTLPESAKKRALGAQSINRVCQIGDIVGPMEFLVSDQSRFITGETIYLGGVR
jgi:3-oxoacyl-[acyl-carrier protein] reductase